MSEMTDLAPPVRQGKRERLVASAADLIHRQGAAVTTLAQVAAAADVPLGNVYYYFKTKDDLIRAVIEDRSTGIAGLLAMFEQRRTPAARLKALARHWENMRELIAAQGCPIGSLCAELSQRGDGLDGEAATLLRLLADWAAVQFRALGRRDADTLAITLLATVQGSALLTNSLHDPAIMTNQVRSIERWIDSLAAAG
jgi:TetR/AcrR family transcriptional regulator, transcriptional repressor for nem operon